MKEGMLKIGVADPKFAVKVPIKVAETLEDISTLAKGSVEYVVDCFMRGHRINLQESDARTLVANFVTGTVTSERESAAFVTKVTAAVSAEIGRFDPTAERKRGGRPARPKNVAVDPKKKTYTPEEMQALLASAGVKVNFTK